MNHKRKRKKGEDDRYEESLKKVDSFILAIGEAAVGILLLINPVGFTVAIIAGVGLLLAVLYGIVILVTGVAKVQWAVDMVRLKKKQWYFQALGAAITLIAAAVVLGNPFGTTAILWMFTAISLIVEAVVDLVGMVLEGKGEMADRRENM